MSTRKKESGSAREKTGTSSSSGTTSRKTSANSSKTASTSRSLDSSPSRKRIPNYLKPTLSSSGDTTKLQGKKPISKTGSAHKPNLGRRRSFDKAPSPTQTLQTSRVSPTPTYRSSPFSGKTTIAPKGDRSSKGTKDNAGKQNSHYARPIGNAKKSSTILGKKGETQTASSRKGPKLSNRTIQDVQETNTNSADQEKEHENSLPVAQEQVDEESITEHLEPKIQKVDSPTSLEQDDTNIPKVESPTIEKSDADTTSKANSPILLEQHDANDVKVGSPESSEQHEANNEVAESSTNIEEGDANEGDIMSEHDEEMENESCIEEQDMGEDITNDGNNLDESAVGSKEEEEDREREAEEKDEEDGASEVDDDGEAREVQEEENATANVAHGKKDLELSNNVIEETTNQLEKQSSRVKALAGAFETVISQQDPK